MWSSRLRAAAPPILLLALNCYLCHELFGIEYLAWRGSIESAYMAISRLMLENWRDLAWLPQWYCGIPFQNAYPPLLHAVVALAAALLRISPALAHHAVTAALYSLGPVAFYFLVLRLSRSVSSSFTAAWLYSLISPAALLIHDTARDTGSRFGALRIHNLVVFGDGPHVAALALLPVAVLSLDIALERRRPFWYFLAGLSIAAIALTNWLGAFALAIAVLCYVLAKSERRVFVTVLLVSLAAYLIASPWLPPSTIRTVLFNSQTIGGDFRALSRVMPWYALVGLAAALGIKLALARFKVRWPIQFAVLFLLFMGAITLAAAWFQFDLVPQPHRYEMEMDLALWLLVGVSMAVLPKRRIVSLALVVLSFFQVFHIRHWTGVWLQPIDIRAATDYKVAHWFDSHLKSGRVEVVGSNSYYLNVFSDTAQLEGGFGQGVVNWYNRVAYYVIMTGAGTGDKDGEISILWLKAFGVDAIGIGGPNSGEWYKAYGHPYKFRGLLEEIWRDGDDFIYRVSRPSGSLAHAVTAQDLVSRPPYDGIDVEPLKPYVAALENPRTWRASWQWTSRHSGVIQADLKPGELVSLQVTYHPGWHATAQGRTCKIRPDAIGLMAIDPACTGACTIEMTYDGGTEMRIVRILSWTTLAFFLAWVLVGQTIAFRLRWAVSPRIFMKKLLALGFWLLAKS